MVCSSSCVGPAGASLFLASYMCISPVHLRTFAAGLRPYPQSSSAKFHVTLFGCDHQHGSQSMRFELQAGKAYAFVCGGHDAQHTKGLFGLKHGFLRTFHGEER